MHDEPPRSDGVGERSDASRGGSLLSGGLRGVALVTLATIALAAGGALIAFVVSLFF